MSKIIYAIIQYKQDVSTDFISDDCFRIVSAACKRKIAINRIDYNTQYLEKGEVGLDISADYIYCAAEDFLEADFSQDSPLEGKRLKDLERFVASLLQKEEITCVHLFVMTSEEYNRKAFQQFDCKITKFVRLYKDMIFTNFNYAYDFVFQKHTQISGEKKRGV